MKRVREVYIRVNQTAASLHYGIQVLHLVYIEGLIYLFLTLLRVHLLKKHSVCIYSNATTSSALSFGRWFRRDGRCLLNVRSQLVFKQSLHFLYQFETGFVLSSRSLNYNESLLSHLERNTREVAAISRAVRVVVADLLCLIYLEFNVHYITLRSN